MVNGVKVKAGQIIGYVGKTGTASNGVIHLHYSIYPHRNYHARVDPSPYLHAVEQNVCGPLAAPGAAIAHLSALRRRAASEQGTVGARGRDGAVWQRYHRHGC